MKIHQLKNLDHQNLQKLYHEPYHKYKLKHQLNEKKSKYQHLNKASKTTNTTYTSKNR